MIKNTFERKKKRVLQVIWISGQPNELTNFYRIFFFIFYLTRIGSDIK